MGTVTRDELHAMVDTLDEERLEAAGEILRELSRATKAELRQQVVQQMRDEGLIVSVPPPMTPAQRQRLRDRPFVKVSGEPVSETVIKNREPVA